MNNMAIRWINVASAHHVIMTSQLLSYILVFIEIKKPTIYNYKQGCNNVPKVSWYDVKEQLYCKNRNFIFIMRISRQIKLT